MPSFLSDITGTNAAKPAPPATGSQAGKVFIVTGGHAGIGKATTKALAIAGAKVYLASRTESKVTEAKKELLSANPELKLEFLHLDLASLKQVKGAAEQFLTREDRLDGLVCNAGIMAVPYELTEDGVETQFQTNFLSHFLFTEKLTPLMEKTGEKTGHPSRVVLLSSFAHNFISWYPFGRPSFDSLQSVNRGFDPLGYIRYSQAKLAAILSARAFNARKSPNVRAVAVHPGFVASELYASQALFKGIATTFISTEEGALTSIYAATSPEVEDKSLWGAYLVPHGKPKNTTAYGNDAKLASELWDFSLALIEQKVGPF